MEQHISCVSDYNPFRVYTKSNFASFYYMLRRIYLTFISSINPLSDTIYEGWNKIHIIDISTFFYKFINKSLNNKFKITKENCNLKIRVDRVYIPNIKNIPFVRIYITFDFFTLNLIDSFY
jgi:hypothetical protein